ncbi:protein translocase subunit SecD [Patescibacteria group bacterium]|nr:protein translocase subunit SecD [Patescibacteria group bacterium]
MPKKKLYIIIIFILILAFLAGNLVYPYAKIFGVVIEPQFLPKKDFKLGLDLQGGAHLIYQADLSAIEKKDKNEAMDGLRDVIERRVNFFGVGEPLVQVQGERLIVELPGVRDVSEAIRALGKTPFLEFKEPKENYQEILEKNEKLLENGEKELEEPFKSTSLTGRYLKKAELGFDQTTNEPLVLLEFDEEGAKIFEGLTEKNVGKPLAIYFDGVLISAPNVQEKISGGRARITGNFTVNETKELVRNLNAGALPVPIKLISQKNVGPSLGKISLEQSLKAGIFGFLAIILFMILFYRLPGILASLALGIYVVLILAIFKLVPVTLTLAGIAGFILSIGMAVDAHVLIFSRTREELRLGKSFSAALEQGFRRAWPAIRDGNLTTLIVVAILFVFGTSFVKGFALTLSLGILMSMFTAIFITGNFLNIFIGTRFEKINWLWR